MRAALLAAAVISAAAADVLVRGVPAESCTRDEAQDALMTLNDKLPDRYSDATIASDRINLRTFTGTFEPMPLAIWSTGCDVTWHERESSRDRFAGAKSHRTAFVGFATKDFTLDEDLRAYVSSSPCPVPGYGKEIIIREYDKTDDLLGVIDGLEHEKALDIEYVYADGDYGGGKPEILAVKMCTGGLIYGWAKARLTMLGHLGWGIRDEFM